MLSAQKIKKIATTTLDIEAKALLQLKKYINDSFVLAVQHIAKSKGRVVITGIGKSAIIAQKIVATFNSTGTPAIFMHAADAIHGDLGIIQKDDIVICLSKSGNTPEIKILVPLLKQSGNPLVAMVGNKNSYLALESNYVLDTTIAKEACPHNLAPTTSSTAQLAMGDALAICLLELKSFSSKDFAKYHPGGALGKKLYLKVGDISSQNSKPIISPDASLAKVIVEITSKRQGAVAVIQKNKLLGVITDGDLRRMLQKGSFDKNITAKSIMNKKPKTIEADALAITALDLMKAFNISQLIVTKKGTYEDLIKEGII
jgi:arabinose-5-phosphate isomerase